MMSPDLLRAMGQPARRFTKPGEFSEVLAAMQTSILTTDSLALENRELKHQLALANQRTSHLALVIRRRELEIQALSDRGFQLEQWRRQVLRFVRLHSVDAVLPAVVPNHSNNEADPDSKEAWVAEVLGHRYEVTPTRPTHEAVEV